MRGTRGKDPHTQVGRPCTQTFLCHCQHFHQVDSRGEHLTTVTVIITISVSNPPCVNSYSLAYYYYSSVDYPTQHRGKQCLFDTNLQPHPRDFGYVTTCAASCNANRSDDTRFHPGRWYVQGKNHCRWRRRLQCMRFVCLGDGVGRDGQVHLADIGGSDD